MSENKIDSMLRRANALYRSGEDSGFTDEEYDNLMEKASDDLKSMVGEEVSKDAVKLPIPMGSLDKVKTIKQLENKLNINDEKNLLITPKFDGIACLIHITNGNLLSAYTRGNGVEGRNITKMVSSHNDIDRLLSIPDVRAHRELFIAGEIVMNENVFEEKYSTKYKNTRNLVAGIFNKKVVVKEVADVRIMFFGVFDKNGDPVSLTGGEELRSDVVNTLGFFNGLFKTVFGNPSEEDLLDVIKTAKDEGWNCDGAVVETNSINNARAIGRKENSLNPGYAVAFKPTDLEEAVTVVKEITWHTSKDRRLAPVIHIDPVDIDGVTIGKLYGDNHKWLRENGVWAGSVIAIVRSNGVIPRVKKVITRANPPKIAETCSCGSLTELGETGVDLFCTNGNCTSAAEAKWNHLAKVFDVDLLGEVMVSKVFARYVEGHRSSGVPVHLLGSHILNEAVMFDEFGVNGRKVSDNFRDALMKADIVKTFHALDLFPGLGSTKIRGVIDLICGYIKGDLTPDHVYNMVVARDGYEAKSANLICSRLHTAKDVFSSWCDSVCITPKMPVPKKEVDGPLNDTVFVFTGFRDKRMELAVENLGGSVGSGLTKKTTHLIVVSKSFSSSKMAKAEKYGTKILDKEEALSLLEEGLVNGSGAFNKENEESLISFLEGGSS